MTNQEIFQVAMMQSAVDLNCSADDFTKNKNVIAISKEKGCNI